MAENAIYLYSTREGNDAMKTEVAKAGGSVKFDKEVGTFALVTEGMDKKAVTALKKKVAEFTTPEAKSAWETDRAASLAAREQIREEARKREPTTTEPKGPKKSEADVANTHIMYRTPPEAKAFTDLAREHGAKAKYVSRSAEHGPHFSVVTTVPQAFSAYMGPEAKARFEAYNKEAAVDTARNPDREVARNEAKARGSKAFMAQYKDRGFRLSDPQRSPEEHQKQLDQMRAATNSQVVEVLRTSRALLEPLRNKEAAMRAEAAGISIEQVKAMSFDEQRAITKDGKPVSLVGDDFKLQAQLSKGVNAMQTELDARGISNDKGRSQERTQEPEKSASQEQAPAERKPRSAAKGGDRGVSEESSVDNTVEHLMAASQRRGQGR